MANTALYECEKGATPLPKFRLTGHALPRQRYAQLLSIRTAAVTVRYCLPRGKLSQPRLVRGAPRHGMLRRRSLDRCCAAVQSYTHAWRRAHATVSEQAKSVLARFELKSEDAKGTLPEPPALEARLGFLKSIGVPSVANAVRRHPPLVHYAVEDMKPRLEYLLSLGIHEVGPMVERAPLLLGCDITRDLQRKVVILQTLGLKKVAKWVSRNPELVHVDLEEDMRPVVVLLRSVHGLKLPRVLPLLGWWHYKDVAGLQAQLDFIAGLVGADKLGAVVSKNARLLTATRANIELKAGLQPNQPVARIAATQTELVDGGSVAVTLTIRRAVGRHPRLSMRYSSWHGHAATVPARNTQGGRFQRTTP